MQVTFEHAGPVGVALLQGRLDSNTAAGVESEVTRFIQDGVTRLVVDLGKLEYISSAGLRVMLIVAKRLKHASGRFVLCNLQPHVSEIFEVSGFMAIMTMASSRAEAIAAAG